MKMKGLTLIEMMITILIFLILAGALFSVLSIGRDSWDTQDTYISLQQEARRALMFMSKELRQTRSSVISGVPPDDNYYSSITFRIPQDIDNDGDVIDNAGQLEWSDEIQYSLNLAGQIIRDSTDGINPVLANHIQSLNFRRYSGNPDVLEISLIAQKNYFLGHSLQVSMRTEVKLRN